MNDNKIIFPITPQTNIRSTQRDKIVFRIPEDCRKLKGKKPCVKFRKTGECPHILSKGGRLRKKRLERYNQYKVDIREMATKAGFTMPVSGWSIYFYFPIPSSWKPSKRKMFHGQLKLSEPDIDNHLKAFFDSLSITDETVAQLSGTGKFWVDTMDISDSGEKTYAPGWIEILLNQEPYNPFNVTFIDQKTIAKAPKRKWVKREEGDPKKRRAKPKPIKLDSRFLKEDKIR